MSEISIISINSLIKRLNFSLSDDKIQQIDAAIKSVRDKMLKYDTTSINITEEPSQQAPTMPKKNKKKKNKNRIQKHRIKLPTMASPARERIPKFKIKLSEIYRIQRLKRERKKRKRMNLFMVARGQSIKREIMTPAHHQVAHVVDPLTEITQQLVNEPSLLNKEAEEVDLVQTYNLKKCQVVLKNFMSNNGRIEPPKTNDEPPKTTAEPQNTQIAVKVTPLVVVQRKRPLTAPSTLVVKKKAPIVIQPVKKLILSFKKPPKKPEQVIEACTSKNLEISTPNKPSITEKSSNLLQTMPTKTDKPTLTQQRKSGRSPRIDYQVLASKKTKNRTVEEQSPLPPKNTPNLIKKVIEKPPTETILRTILQSVPKPTLSPPSKRIKISNAQTITKVKFENSPGYKSPPMVAIPSELLSPLTPQSVLLSAELTMLKLRPWLKESDHQKRAKVCDEMLNSEHCLAALFKCMASSCSFYTCNAQIFDQHMRIHWVNQPYDRNNFSHCPYCSFKSELSYKNLIKHIGEEHDMTK